MAHEEEKPNPQFQLSDELIAEINEAGASTMPEVEAVEKSTARAEALRKRLAVLLETVRDTAALGEYETPHITDTQKRYHMEAINELAGFGITLDDFYPYLFGTPLEELAEELMERLGFPLGPRVDLNKNEG